MVAVRTNLFATLSLRVGADVIKVQRGMIGIDCFFFFTRHKCFLDIGSFANIYAHLQILLKIQ